MSDANQNSSTEHARVQALLESGRITQDEAEILFAALEEGSSNIREKPFSTSETSLNTPNNSASDDGDNLGLTELTSLSKAVTDEELGLTDLKPVQPPQPPTSALPLPPQLPKTPQTPQKIESTVQQWVKLSGFCGDLSVETDPALNSPVVTGKATLERTETGYLIRTPPEAKSEGNWLTRLHQAAGDVKVRLPENVGLDLRIAAGDGEVRGVRAVKGSFTGGDFRLTDTETVDLTVTAGDVTAKLRPRAGEQRLRTTSGDVNLTFLAGASVTVSGSATCGDLTLPPTFSRNGGFVGGNFEGTLGAGEARLELHLIAGDVTVRADV